MILYIYTHIFFNKNFIIKNKLHYSFFISLHIEGLKNMQKKFFLGILQITIISSFHISYSSQNQNTPPTDPAKLNIRLKKRYRNSQLIPVQPPFPMPAMSAQATSTQNIQQNQAHVASISIDHASSNTQPSTPARQIIPSRTDNLESFSSYSYSSPAHSEQSNPFTPSHTDGNSPLQNYNHFFSNGNSPYNQEIVENSTSRNLALHNEQTRLQTRTNAPSLSQLEQRLTYLTMNTNAIESIYNNASQRLFENSIQQQRPSVAQQAGKRSQDYQAASDLAQELCGEKLRTISPEQLNNLNHIATFRREMGHLDYTENQATYDILLRIITSKQKALAVANNNL